MEPPVLRVVRAAADDQPSPNPSTTEPVRTPMRWTVPMSEPSEETVAS